MKKLIALVTVMCSFAVIANSVVLMPGHSAGCKKKYDVHRSKTQNIYSLSNPRVKDLGDEVELTVTLKFLLCTEYTENGVTKYKFETSDNHMRSNYTSVGTSSGIPIEVERIDLKKELLAYNKEYNQLALVNVSENTGSEDVTLIVKKDQLDINKFPRAISKGKYYATLMLKSQTKFESVDNTIGPMIKAGGKYRIFFDL